MIREKKKFLVRWKEYTMEKDIWENRENLENMKELVEEFEKEYREEAEELRQQELEEEEREFSQELSREFMAKLLYRQGKKRYEKEKERRQNENWSQQKNSLEQGNLKRGPCYESSRKEITFCTFEQLIHNLKTYNGIKL